MGEDGRFGVSEPIVNLRLPVGGFGIWLWRVQCSNWDNWMFRADVDVKEMRNVD